MTRRLPAGAVQVFPPSLSDQFKLLTPSTHRDAAQSQATADLYSTVNKTPRTRSEGDGGGEGEASPADSGRYRSLSDSHPSAAGSAEKGGKSLFIHDITPPWKQMVSVQSLSRTDLTIYSVLVQRAHNSSNSSSDSPNAVSEQSPHTARQPTPPPPPLPRRSYTPPTQSHPLQDSAPRPDMEGRQLESPGLYDRLPMVLPPPPIPSKAGEEGVYDIIPGHKRHRYLHEKMAACDKNKEQARSTPPLSWTPQLPPRNRTGKLTRTCSAELMGSLVKGRALTRHGSERRSSSLVANESRERSASTCSSKRGHNSSTEREQEKRVKHDRHSSDHHHHSRSSDRTPSERRSSSGEKHRSLSAERHRSSLAERHRSSSAERHRSSPSKKHRRSPDEKHRSSSREKHGSSSSEKRRSSSEKHPSPEKKSSPKSEKSGSAVWRILSSTRSSTKSSSAKEPARKNGKEERREKDREKKHRSQERRGSGDLTAKTHSSVSERDVSMVSVVSQLVRRFGVYIVCCCCCSLVMRAPLV